MCWVEADLNLGMVWYLQDLPEKVLGMSSIWIGATFNALFSCKFLSNDFHQAFIQSLFVWYGGMEGRKITSGYARVSGSIQSSKHENDTKHEKYKGRH